MKNFQIEYNDLPKAVIATQDESELQRTRGTILRVLLGEELKTNPKGIPFFDPPAATKDRKRGLYDDEKGEPVLVDPWGEPYYFVIDLNNDHKTPNPDTRADQPRELLAEVIAFSAGPDRDPATWNDNITSW